MIAAVKKRDGRLEKFKPEKITWAIFKAATAVGGMLPCPKLLG